MCDTFVALPPMTDDGSIIFGKNSDREPNEAQILEFHPRAENTLPAMVQCTYSQIPQVKETYATLLSRPFWMWGAEMGANEKGVVIGNEAVWTRMPLQKNGGLTGMDLLRLALERSATAEQALETIVSMLADFGQGGICGYEDKRMAYHNSFIITDSRDSWVLETAGPLYAAKKITDYYSISNSLTIGEIYDESHPELVETARKNGWLKPGQTFHFARCFSDWFYTTFSASRRRTRRSLEMVDTCRGVLDVASAVRILRDHHGESYRPDAHFLGNRICAHAANKLARNATQTTGSLIAHLKADRHTYFATGTAAPCTAIFKPIWLNQHTLPDIGPIPDGLFNSESLWWSHEKLHRSVLLDYQNRIRIFSRARDRMENAWIQDAFQAPFDQHWEMTQNAFRQAGQKTREWTAQVQSRPVQQSGKWTYGRYWKNQNRKASISVS
jgi:dipeptidase